MKEMNRDEIDMSAGGAAVAVAGALGTAGHASAGATILHMATAAKCGAFAKAALGAAALGPLGVAVGVGFLAVGVVTWLSRD